MLPPTPVRPLSIPPRFRPCSVSLLPLSTLCLGHFIHSYPVDILASSLDVSSRMPISNFYLCAGHLCLEPQLPKIQPIYKQTYYHLFLVCFPLEVPILSQGITILSVNLTRNLRISSPPTSPLDPFMSPPINSCCPGPFLLICP